MNCNILLLGQTGVGKSALLNYLAGEKLAESGISSKRGGITRGINKYQIDINGQECSVSDSEGLELNHEKEWEALVDKELFPKAKPKSIFSWYHIVVFCIGASSARVQDYELDIIERLIESQYGVIIALTKSDLASEEELNHIREELLNHFEGSTQITIIPVCSKKRRNNTLEGKEEISSVIIESWEQTLINRLPEHVFSPTFDALDDWLTKTREWLYGQKVGVFHKSRKEIIDELYKRVNNGVKSIDSRLVTRLKRSFKEVSQVNQAIGQALDYESLKAIESSVAPRFNTLEASFAFEGNTVPKIAIAIGLAVSTLFPIVATLATITGVMGIGKGFIEALDEYLINHYCKLARLYHEQEIMMGYRLADTFGYYYGKREVAICYLKGRGAEQNILMFASTIREVERLITAHMIEDGRGEYYVAYYYLSKHTSEGDRIGKKWLKQSYLHGYEDAASAFKFGDIFAKMKEIELLEEEEWENYWNGHD